ncbi:hypothetical protein ON010_g18405 [Phytophthora cinnamomi]|nr:hypothetical protein ON010_g18405 [Phytophthora cinnamomi]
MGIAKAYYSHAGGSGGERASETTKSNIWCRGPPVPSVPCRVHRSLSFGPTSASALPVQAARTQLQHQQQVTREQQHQQEQSLLEPYYQQSLLPPDLRNERDVIDDEALRPCAEVGNGLLFTPCNAKRGELFDISTD